eukprot:TRINITY_DN84163_c0_g1_i1.p1 TRINITY_DN84163_c0_g1~~TRINITY_DN84163_c0_g1_i1.p1  ORF type:complete len:237 (+),score=36.93 TRINITY_DN84163_c0_g1_i1:106-711(+)
MADSKLYLFCGLEADAAELAVRGGQSSFKEVDGLLGQGIYCTTRLDVASKRNLNTVVVVRAFPGGKLDLGRGIKVVDTPDPGGQWQIEGFVGCWMPPAICPVADPKGELCLRSDILGKTTFHRSAWSADKSSDVRATEWLLLSSLPHGPLRWRLSAELISWPVLALTVLIALVALAFLWIGMYQAAGGAAAVAGIFSLAIL